MIELLNLKNDILLEENEDRFSEIDLFLNYNKREQNQLLQELILFTDKNRKYKSLSYIQLFLNNLSQENLLEIFSIEQACFHSKKLNALRLDNLLNCGELKQFEKVFVQLLSHLCTYKYHAYVSELIEQYESHTINKDYALLTKILLLVETSNFTELYQCIKAQVGHELTRDSSYKISKIKSVLSNFEFDDVYFLKSKLLVKVWNELALAGDEKQNLSSKEIITFIVLFSNDKELMYIFNSIESKSSLYDYLRSVLNIKPFDIPKYLTTLRNFSVNKFKVKPIIKEQKSIIKREEPISKKMSPQSNIADDLLDDQSGQVVWAVKNSEMSDEQIQSMIIALIETKQFQSAMKLTSELKENSNKYYMQAEISLKLKEFRECIYYANQGLQVKNLTTDEVLSFLYLKYLAYKELSNEQMVHEYKRKIMMLNPTYRNININ